MGPRLALPEIVLCPAAFQLPGGPQDDRRYLADFVDLDRREAPLPELADVGRPLVYCSLGSSAPSYPHAERFFAAVVGASRIRRDWSFVLHVADHPAPQAYAAQEPNLHVHRWVPQLSLLRDASVMVTHGGLNSIMECIHFQVPMVIVPGARDQPGNAVRAVHQGLAVTAAMRSLTPALLVDLVDQTMRNPRLRASLAAMKQAMAAEPGLVSAVAFVEERARPTMA
jgi:zeaxanthin glucosyltransferase